MTSLTCPEEGPGHCSQVDLSKMKCSVGVDVDYCGYCVCAKVGKLSKWAMLLVVNLLLSALLTVAFSLVTKYKGLFLRHYFYFLFNYSSFITVFILF